MALLSSIVLFSCSKDTYFSGISETSFNEIKENYQNINYSKEDVIAIIGPPLIKEKSKKTKKIISTKEADQLIEQHHKSHEHFDKKESKKLKKTVKSPKKPKKIRKK